MLTLKKIVPILGLLGLFGFFSACSTSVTKANVKQEVKDVKKIPDTDLSYRNVDLLKGENTPQVKYPEEDPGEATRMQRSFENAPPLIPHNIEDFVPITREDNECLGCHDPKEAKEAEAPPTPASHMYDFRRNKKLTVVNHANYNCTLCHVPQSNASILIGNNFKADYRSEKSKKSSNLLDVMNEGVKGE